MNREIKIRVFDSSTKLMIDLPHLSVEFGIIERNYDCETIMLCSGLKDKKGVEIFEGDILKNPSGKKDIVIWFGNGFYGKSKHTHDKNRIISNPLCFDYLENKEIIGNIYENPDLLTN